MNDKEIKLSDQTTKTFKKLYSINQSLRILEDNRTVKSINETKTLAAYVEIEESFPRDFCVYDLGEFISVLNIVNEPVLDFSNDRYVIVKSSDNSQRLKYVETNPELITSYFDNAITLKSEDVVVNVDEKSLKAVMKSASTLRLEYIGFRADGEKVYFTTFNRRVDSDNQEMNAFTIELGPCEDKFDIFYPTEIMTVLDDGCEFTFSKGQRISRVRCANMEYWIAMDKDSEIE
jgi:hypothetical protein